MQRPYRILYKKFSEIRGNFEIVEEVVIADRFRVEDGALVLYTDVPVTNEAGPEFAGVDELPFMAIPSPGWFICEPAVPESTAQPSVVVP